MTGRLADLFRLAWGLLYWNFRKSWFRFRRGRVGCPCQAPSDSGRAFETACDASLHWHRPADFRRVCPLLVQTDDGLRCSVNTADVRPFWGRAAAYYGGTLLTLYLAAAIGLFAFLRTVGYPVNVFHVVWPGLWYRVREDRGWFFMQRAQQAFDTGRPSEGLLYLSNAYEFNPGNYTVATSLAQKLQLGQPQRSDEIYRQLLVDHPEQQAAIAQTWFHALLARGDFEGVAKLARRELVDDSAHASPWMRALIFATRQTDSDAILRDMLAADAPPPIRPWRLLVQTELLLRTGRLGEARTLLEQSWRGQPTYSLFFQVEALIAHDDPISAVDRLQSYGRALDDTARATLLLEAYATLGLTQPRDRLVTVVLAPTLQPPTIDLLATYLIRHPNQAVLDQLFAKFVSDGVPLQNATLESILALYCAAGVNRDWSKMHQVANLLRTNGSVLTLGVVEAFFRGDTTQTRIASLLPALPLPLNVDYALLERYPGPLLAAPATKP